jgi:hypothetical protein
MSSRSSALKSESAPLAVDGLAVGIAQPLSPSYISSHQPSSTDRLRPPLMAAFMPEVPQASSGRSGLFSQTSQPGNSVRAMAMS